MKQVNFFLVLSMLTFLVQSCGITAKFPVSSIVPAADITATKSVDKNKNYVIKITAKSLANPERLNPPKKNYVVWGISNNGNITNLGQFIVGKHAQKNNVFKTTTPYNISQIFITAEDQGDLIVPTGVEISRMSFKK